MKSTPATYAHAIALLGSNPNRPQKRLAGKATTAHRLLDGSIAIVYHNTSILTFRPNGQIVITSGGFRSNTTKAKINEYLPPSFPRVWADRGVWTIGGETFMDGDTLTTRGTLLRKAGRTEEAKRIAKLTKQINAFAGVCADAVPLPLPGAGDCLMCQMERDGKQDAGTGHLIEHMREGYAVPSLVLTALEATGYGDTIKAATFGQMPSWVETARDYVRKAVRRYLKARFGIAGGCFGRLSGGVHGDAEGIGAKPSAATVAH
jgi:hypothetical protein